MDAVVILRQRAGAVDRIFLLRDVEKCNKAFAVTGAVAQMAHQVVTKDVAKTEFILGVASLIVDAIAIEQYPHIHEKMAEIIINLETMRAFCGRARWRPR